MDIMLAGFSEFSRFDKIFEVNAAVVLLGSNSGNLPENLRLSHELITEKIGSITHSSSVYETEPWGRTDQPAFLNQVIIASTSMDAVQTLQTLLEIENLMGRQRVEKWAPRIIDLDILYFNDDIISQHGLTIPHPHLHERRFTMAPLAEILPDWIHPVLKKTNRNILTELKDDLGVKAVNSVDYFVSNEKKIILPLRH